MHPTPLRVDKIVAILKSVSTRSLSRSIHAARVMGNPLDGSTSALVSPICLTIADHLW
jgi:hypothetical protein